MGANDAAEMLEAAKAECVRLERELAAAQAAIAEALDAFAHSNMYWDGSRALTAPERARQTLSQSPTDALQAHDRQVWEAGYDEGYADCRDASGKPNPYATIVSEPSTPEGEKP